MFGADAVLREVAKVFVGRPPRNYAKHARNLCCVVAVIENGFDVTRSERCSERIVKLNVYKGCMGSQVEKDLINGRKESCFRSCMPNRVASAFAGLVRGPSRSEGR